MSRKRGGVLALAVALSVPLAGTVSSSFDDKPPGRVVGAAAASEGLAFAMPSTDTLRASPRKVFAHYLPSLTVSLDNEPPDSDYYARNYLRPEGEGGRHLSYGGFLRDRPMSRAPRQGHDWRQADLRDEVRQARAAGLDGFSIDLLKLPGGTDARVAENVTLLLNAAAEVDPGFEIMLMPDLSGSLRDATLEQVTDYVAGLGQHSSAYRLDDGRLVVAPFHAETHTPAWWRQFMQLMRSRHALEVAFLPVFLDERRLISDYASFSYGLSNWGTRNPEANDPTSTLPASPKGRAAAVHEGGMVWMQPVSMQDERPRSASYQEALATQNLRNTWRIAIEAGAELVQIATWNDYAEGSQLAPSERNNWAQLDISTYYLVWFKTGAPPTLRRDVVYVTHRTQSSRSLPLFPQTRLMKLRSDTPAVDQVEALALLPAPATVRLTVGGHTTSCRLPAGPGICTAPLRPGAVSAQVLRGGVVTAAVVSPQQVTTTPAVQDLHYESAGSTGLRPRVPAD
jgi:hypothetical protein